MKAWQPITCLTVVMFGASACIPMGRGEAAPNVRLDPAVIVQEDGVTSRSESARPMVDLVVPKAVKVADAIYVVAPGDSLRSIGNKTGAGSEAIALANNLAKPFVVKVGQRLQIPGGRYHLVSAGETGIAIARAYGTRWEVLITLNQLEPPYVLRLGRRLKVPSGTDTANAVDATKARAQNFSVHIDEIFAGAVPVGGARDTTVQTGPGRVSATSAAPTATAMLPARVSGFIWPIVGAKLARRFGPYGEGRVNRGVDIAAPEGTAIRAVAEGVVVYAARDVALFDGLVLLRHAEGWTSAYGSAADLRVREGQAVRKGEVIGLVGPGQDQGPQLHFELRRNQIPVDPVRYLGL